MLNLPGNGLRARSHWSQTVEPREWPVATGTISTDVVVVGGGLTGLTTAFLLKQAGHRVVVLEAARVGGGATGGSSGRLSALEAPAFAALEKEHGVEGARIYAEAVQWALAQIADAVQELDIPCAFTRRPALMYTTEPAAVKEMDREVAAARRAGLAVERVTDSDLPLPIEAGAYLPDQAHFHPLRYCLGLARFVHGDGSLVFEGSRVSNVAEADESMGVRTTGDARIEASWVVMACGLPPLDRGGFFARTYPLVSHCVALEGRGHLPDSLSIRLDLPTCGVHSVAGPGGSRLLIVGGEGHRVDHEEDARDRYGRLEAYAREHFPVGNVTACWSLQEYATPDGIPMIGRIPFGSPRLLIATGLRRGGLTMGPAAARILSDLVLGRSNPWSEFFDAGRTRFAPSNWAAVRAQVANGGQIRAAHFASGGGPPERVSPGSAAICSRDGELMAVFRDEGGTLYELSAACTHRGCQVVWNAFERSWDCTCHGSRFGIDGRVVHGPAVRPLERFNES